MSYGATILDLNKVIEISETLKSVAIERAMHKINDEDLQEYRDYQVSVVHYLEQLKGKK